MKSFKTRTQAFSSDFFSYCIMEWNKLNDKVRNAVSIIIFKNQIVNFIKTKENSLSGIHDILGVKLLTCLRLNFSHLNEHKFRHNFKDTINPMCSCGSDIESTMHFLLRCQNYSSSRLELLNSIYALRAVLKQYSDEKLLEVLLYGSDKFDIDINRN